MSSRTHEKERHSGDAKTSVKAPAKKAGGGGRYTMGKAGETSGGTFLDRGDPNFDPDEKRVDPEDDVAYKFDELAAFYKGKFNKQAVKEYWEYTCTPLKKKRSKAEASSDDASKGPTIQESLKPKWAPKGQAKAPKAEGKRSIKEDLEGDGPLAKEVAALIPHFPYGKLEKFYDIQGLMQHPKLFDAVCAVLAKRYRKMGITKIAAFESRGFLFTPVSIKLGVPFVMLRKDGKLPDSIKSTEFTKEHEGVETIAVQNGAVVAGDKVALLDDLMATGSTLISGIELIKALKAEVTECACLIEIKGLKGRERCLKAGATSIFGFISDDLCTGKAKA